MFQTGVLADSGRLLVIFAGAVGFGKGTSVGVTLDAGGVVGRVSRAGQCDTSESHLVGCNDGSERG